MNVMVVDAEDNTPFNYIKLFPPTAPAACLALNVGLHLVVEDTVSFYGL